MSASLIKWPKGMLRHPLALAFLFGMLTVLALPPLSLLPAGFLGIAGFGYLLGRVPNAWHAALVGWGYFFGYHLLGLYWVSFSLFTDIARYWWLVPFSVTGLPAGLGLFGALIGWGGWHFGRLSGGSALARWLGLGLSWGLVEYGRTFLFTGFPWNLIGMIWSDWLAIAQTASLIGLHGLGLFTVLGATVPMLWPAPHKPPRWALGALLPWVLLGGWGAMRVQNTLPDQHGIALWLVQPNIDMAAKHDQARQQHIIATLLRLSAGAPIKPDHQNIIIWPETAIGYSPGEDAELRGFLQQNLPQGAWLMTGAPHRTRDANGTRRYYNSLYLQNPVGDIAGRFDKKHLVPFGEYMPLRGYLPLDAIAAGAIDLSAGVGPRLISTPGLPPFAASICYEAIFPGAVTDPDCNGTCATWMVNVTNDGWFGHSAGPHQHFAMARMRAIEEGIPMVRVANTGISGVIDAFGRVRTASTLGTETALSSPLPGALSGGVPYVYWRDRPFYAVLGLIGMALWLCRRRAHKAG